MSINKPARGRLIANQMERSVAGVQVLVSRERGALTAKHPSAARLAGQLIEWVHAGMGVCTHLPTRVPVMVTWAPGLEHLSCHLCLIAFTSVAEHTSCDACGLDAAGGLDTAMIGVGPVLVVAAACRTCTTTQAPRPVLNLRAASETVEAAMLTQYRHAAGVA